MLYGRLLDENAHCCESLSDLSYPVVLLQGRKSGSDRFIERLRGDLYGVLNVSNILYRNCARSQNHTLERNIFAFCSLCEARGGIESSYARERVRSTRSHLAALENLSYMWQG